MMNSPAVLGLIAGGTIFLGLPLAKLNQVSAKTKAFLNAVSTGILIFLLVEIMGHLMGELEELIDAAVLNGASMAVPWRYGSVLVIGFSFGLLGMVVFERFFLGAAKDDISPRKRAKQIAFLMAVGLGLHNISEGLAIGQGHAAGAIHLAWLLAIGFALHNATEGFGIAAPLSGHQTSWGFLSICGLIAGGPTFVGAVIGSWFVNRTMEVFCLALAAGTILYIIGELLHLGRFLKGEAIVEIGLLVGFFLAMGTDFALASALELTAAHAPRHGGYFGDANDVYHYELIRPSSNKLVLYVNDHLNRPMDARSLRGRWILNPDNANSVTGFFTAASDGKYLASDLPDGLTKTPLHLKVEVLKGRNWVAMEFVLPPA